MKTKALASAGVFLLVTVVYAVFRPEKEKTPLPVSSVVKPQERVWTPDKNHRMSPEVTKLQKEIKSKIVSPSFKQAKASLKKDDVKTALLEFNKVLNVRPQKELEKELRGVKKKVTTEVTEKNRNIYLQVALSLVLEGKYTEAIGILQKVLQKLPDDKGTQKLLSLAYTGLANGYDDKKQYNDAEKHYKEAIQYDAKNTKAYLNFAISLLRQEKLKDAEDAAQKALALNSKDPQIFLVLGNIYKKQDKLSDALLHYKNALQIILDAKQTTKITLAELLNQIADAYLKLDDLASAEDAAKEAVKIMPEYFVAHITLGEIYEKMGKIQDALQEYEVGSKDKMYGAVARANVKRLKKEG